MIRMILAAAMLVSVTAQADTKLGYGRTSEDKRYFDVNVKTCVNAIRVEVKDTNQEGKVDLGRIYISAQGGPAWKFTSFTKVNTRLAQGESTGWIAVPASDSCLQRIRVYAESTKDDSHTLRVYGSN